jgi:leucyl-tRNA synthetase
LWPEVNKEYLNIKRHTIVIQINGKKRALITTEKELEKEELIKDIKDKEDINKYLEKKKIIKVIFIKNKLINLIVK